MSVMYSIMTVWLMWVTPTLHWMMFREQRGRTACNFVVRTLIVCSYLIIMLKLVSIRND